MPAIYASLERLSFGGKIRSDQIFPPKLAIDTTRVAKILNNSQTAFPNESDSPEKKAGKEWCRQFAEAAWNARSNMPYGGLGYSSRDMYKMWWDYAYNRQPLEQYKKMSGITNTDLISESSRLPISNKVFNIVTGLIEKQGWKIRVGAIDPGAKIELKGIQAERKAKLMMRQVAPDMANHPLIAAKPGEPNDLEGLDIMNMGERLPICADALDAINAVFGSNKYDRLRREAIQCLFVIGAIVGKDDTETDCISMRACDVGDIIMNYCKYPDFSDMQYIGELRTLTISSLVEMACGQVKKSELEALYKDGAGLGWTIDGQGYGKDWYSNCKVQVLDLEIRSTDIIRKEEYRNKEGNLRYREVVYKKDGSVKEVEGSKKTDMEIQNIYRVKWVVGTDIVFDYGKGQNIKRNNRNPAKAQFSYHVIAPNIKDMVPYSRMAAIIPMIDDIQVMNYKRRWTLMRAIPSGWAIDLEGMEDIDLTGGGQALTKKELMDLFVRTGNFVFRSRQINGNLKGSSGPPVSFLKGGIGDEVVEYSNQITYNANLINQTLGLNEATDGSTVNAKNLNSTNQAMLTGTNNALSDLFFADKQLAEDFASSVLLRAQDLMRPDASGKSRAYEFEAIIGVDSVKRLGEAPPLDKYSFGITIEDAPTAAEEEDFNLSLNQAMAAGQISIDERFMAKSIAEDNIIQAQLYLSYRVRKNKEEQANQTAANTQQTAQLQMQSAQATAEEERKTIKFKTDEEIRKAQELHALEMQKLGAQGGVKLEAERIGASGRVESAFVQAKERDTSNMRDNTGKLLKEGMDSKVDVINIAADLKSNVEPLTSPENPGLPKPAFSFLDDVAPPQPEPMPQQQPQQMMPEGMPGEDMGESEMMQSTEGAEQMSPEMMQ